MTRRQARMFGEADLPLFSGTAPAGRVEAFDPAPAVVAQQQALPGTQPRTVRTQTCDNCRMRPADRQDSYFWCAAFNEMVDSCPLAGVEIVESPEE